MIYNFDLTVLETEALQFSGPKTNHCFGTPYVTFALGGIKPEGGDQEWESDAKTAHDRFFTELNEYVSGAQQIAWRLYPEMTITDDRMYTLRCRLAVWK
jgi:hypothetical protein